MIIPGELDENGWRIPKKPRAIRVYALAKQGLRPSVIAKLTGLQADSVRVMLFRIRNPTKTHDGYVYYGKPKTAKRQFDFTGKNTERFRRYRERRPVRELELQAYNGARYTEIRIK